MADYSAHAVLGIIVDASRFSTRIKAYPHEHPAEWRVDPLSGRQLWRVQSGREFLEALDYGAGLPVELVEVGYESDTVAIGFDLCRCQGEEETLVP